MTFSVAFTDAGDVLQLYAVGGDAPIPDNPTMGLTLQMAAGAKRAWTGIVRKPDGTARDLTGYKIYFAARYQGETTNLFQHDNDTGSGFVIDDAATGAVTLTIAEASTSGELAGVLDWDAWWKDASGNTQRIGRGLINMAGALAVIP